MEVKKLAKAYDKAAQNFLFTRTDGKGISGFWNREIEQPLMYKLVPQNLKGKKLLDIGCGPGIHLKEYVLRGADGVGIDISKEMITLAKKYCPEAKFEIGNIENLQFKDESFDIVTASFILDHLKDLNKSITGIKRTLNKGGKFIFSVPHPISNMYPDWNEGSTTPTKSYFDTQEIIQNIAKSGNSFVDYPRQLSEYINPFVNNGFILQKILENQPQESWKGKYKELNENAYKIPFLLFISLIKA